MAKRIYNERDKTTVVALLKGNGGNVKRTSRESNVPVSTVRDWKREMESGELSAEVRELLPSVIEDIAEAYERVRNKSLLLLEAKVESGNANARELVAIVGMLTDKLNVMRGEATRITEHKVALPSREEMQQLMAGMFQAAVSERERREEEIVEAEWEEPAPKALPPAVPTKQEE